MAVCVKATEQYFHAETFSMSCKMVLFTIQNKTTEQYFPVMLFIMLFKVVLTLESG